MLNKIEVLKIKKGVYMKDDDIALVVCSPEDAEYLTSKDPNIIDSLVITRLLPTGQLIMIPADEFIDYLYDGDTHRADFTLDKDRSDTK